MKLLEALAALMLMGCSASEAEERSTEPSSDSQDVVGAAAIREISCNADARQRHSSYHLRISTDGKVREGTVLRGFSKDSPDYRVDVKSVTKVGDRLRIEMSEGANAVRFTISSAGFDAKTRAALDAKVEQTTDQAILDVGKLECTLSDSAGGLVMLGDDAKKLYESLNVAPLGTNVGDEVKVVETKGPFRLYSKTNLATLRIPAIVTAASGGRVSYSYELDANESRALAGALRGGAFTGTTFENAWSGAKAEAKMDLSCSGASCKASYTMPDSFYENVAQGQ